MENATVETPSDINDEVRKVLYIMKRKASPAGEPGAQQHHELGLTRRPRSAVRRLRRTNQSEALVNSPASPPPISSSSPIPKGPAERLTSKASIRNRSPGVVPEVTLLGEQRRRASKIGKPIGFRPPWMCEV